ncbi:hypothetical protein FACS1894177_09330 [Bacteroidia bacterium]|nr:hypothetical protein FACS1894177_09330 [Bacteroidia bacterium]
MTDAPGEPLPGVSIAIKGTTTGTATDLNGNYSISVPNGNAVLVFSYIGSLTQEITVGNKSSIDITLKENVQEIGDVVVTGYGGTRSRAKLTNSIAKVKNETFDVGVFSNPAQALSGAVAGLRVINNSGNPTATPSIILRGGTNLDGSGAPLIMVDGQVRSNLSDINPADIESMEIMKDAGATALYGARANNGVVLITTKSGKTGHTEISANIKVGLNYLNNPYKMMNARDYLYWVRTGYRNAGEIWKDQNGNWQGYSSLSLLKNPAPYGTGNLYRNPADPQTPLDGNKDTRAVWSPMILNDDNRFLLDQGWQTMTDPIYGDEIIFTDFD